MANKNKIIVIEGTDCSGKQTQSEMLVESLTDKGINTTRFCFPNYDSPTGKIIGGAYLGKPHIGECVFPEGAVNVEPKVAGLYYAADRLYNLPKIEKLLETDNVVLDRYVDSNTAHQGGKIHDKEQRYLAYNWFENLEYGLLNLPRPDIRILLYMPYEYALKLRQGRDEKPDQHELDPNHLKNAENAYLEIAERNQYKVINCVQNGRVRTPSEIHEEVLGYVLDALNK